MAQQACELFVKQNHGVLNYACLNFGCAYCSDCLRENLGEVPVAEIYRRSSKAVQYQTFSSTGFRLHFYQMKSYKLTYNLKKKVVETYRGPIQVSSLCSTRLEAGLLTSSDWIILDRDNYKVRERMTYFTDISSMPEFKAYEGGTQEKLGGMVATNPCYQCIATQEISSPSCFKKIRNPTTPRLPDGAER
jgi:hypothetical protein